MTELVTQPPTIDGEHIPAGATQGAAPAPQFSGLLQNIFPDGTIQYSDEIGPPEQFPLTEAEWNEVRNPT